ncbi:MAG: HEAT repeat domain-containing protein [Geobacteraceae bacterium]|nr:HEAT repeat domain-containing protein [Geobacteraceae bacterium]
MQTLEDPQLEQALVSLSRLLKAASYYPGAHPAVNKAVHEATEKLQQGLATSSEGVIALEIKRQGFLCEELWLSPENKILAQLAQVFFRHKIKSLVLFADLREQHLLTLAHCLNQEPQQLEARGGAARVLEGAQATSIVLNQIDLNAIVASRQKPTPGTLLQTENTAAPSTRLERGSGKHTAEMEPTERRQSLALMLQKAQRLLELGTEEQLPAFQGCLNKIRHRLDSILAIQQYRSDALQAIALLDRWIQARSNPAPYVSASKQCLRQLDPGRSVAMLLDCAHNNSHQRNLALRTIKLLDSRACAMVWEQLIVEPNPQMRRFLTRVMAALGPAADQIMLEHLYDSRWYVARNALNILGSRRNPEYISAFRAQLEHRDQRVVKEAISALAAIRHERATDVLLEYLSTPGCVLAELTILALGAQQDSRAVPILSRIALQHDRLLKRKKIRLKAIEALGESRDPSANTALVKIIQKGKIIKRSEYRELRLAAIRAVGKTATAAERDLLERLSSGHDAQIAKCARQALQTEQKE